MDLKELERHLQGTMFAGKAHWFEEVDSTNTLAAEAAAQGAEEGTLFVADAQTAGRGRGGHSWHSEPGSGLYFSFVLRPWMRTQDVLWISLAAGAAVYEGVRAATGLAGDIRWPNDLLIGRKKFCGILNEMHGGTAIVGIGINVNHALFPAEIEDIATSLRIESGIEQDRCDVLAAVLRAFDGEYRSLLSDIREGRAGASLLERLPAMSSWIRGKQVQVPEQGGYTGVTAGLDARGFLLVETEQGVRTVMSGGVREGFTTETRRHGEEQKEKGKTGRDVATTEH
jgi:BirA family biotin operon repressor/biotin-[acetyl-CoA-carboxylase] ligase